MQLINLRSDTQTLPTEEMLEAMRNAPLGDDTFDEDPTVQRLEKLAAEKVGKEAAMLVISGTMGNLVSLIAHTQPGDEVFLDRYSHIFAYEGGGIANVAGLMPQPLVSKKGCIDEAEIEHAIRKKDIHFPQPRLLCIENTHNLSGGMVVPLERHRKLCETARAHGMAVHLDGARIFNAAAAAGIDSAEYTKDVDSVMFCLSKGLSCPLGSIVAGSRMFIEQADRIRKRLGGGMRQAGVIAAAGIVALETMIERLKDDHAMAKRLGEKLNDLPGISVNVDDTHTNMVLMDHSGLNKKTEEVVSILKEKRVLVSPRPPFKIRLVTHRHHDEAVIDDAVERIRKALL